MKFVASRMLAAGLAITCWGLGAVAAAQEAPARHTEAVPTEAPVAEDQTVVSAALGATGNSGNTEAVSGNAGGNLQLVRGPSVFAFDVLGTLGYAKAAEGGDLEQTAANVVGRARYDYFLTSNDALFAALAPRRDTFAGIAARLQWQAGYLRTLFNRSEDHRLWSEYGFDITQDYYTNEKLDTEVVTPDEVFYSARVFLGYTNRLSAYAGINTGIEFLYDVEDPGNYRINGSADLTSTLTDRFKLGVGFRVQYDHEPVEGAERADTISTLQAVYSFDSLADQEAAPECPPCECETIHSSETAAAEPKEPVTLGESGEVEQLAPEAAAAGAGEAAAGDDAGATEVDVDTATPAEVNENAPAPPVADPQDAAPKTPATPEEASPTPTPQTSPAPPAEEAPSTDTTEE